MSVDRNIIQSIIDDLQVGKTPQMKVEDFPCFSDEATTGKDFISPKTLKLFAGSLTKADIPTFERILRAIDDGELAWIGFKVVIDPEAAQANIDNEVTKKYGDVGSADGELLVFFCNDEKEIVASREYSARDAFQMKDCTRGPSMHNDQFEGLTWVGLALFDPIRVWLLGASDASSEVAALADHVGFDVAVVDYDEAYINEKRFPHAERFVLERFEDIGAIEASQNDYVCVLTRGHIYDPEGCIWALRNQAHYVGMMGCAGKNDRVEELLLDEGIDEADWDRIKRPIGLKFGAKTPAELAIAVVAELVDVRYKQRYSEEARVRHDTSLRR